MWYPKSEHRSPDELIDYIARTRALNTSPFAKAGPERPFRLATAFCDGSLVYTFHQTREAAEEAYEALVAHYGALGETCGAPPQTHYAHGLLSTTAGRSRRC